MKVLYPGNVIHGIVGIHDVTSKVIKLEKGKKVDSCIVARFEILDGKWVTHICTERYRLKLPWSLYIQHCPILNRILCLVIYSSLRAIFPWKIKYDHIHVWYCVDYSMLIRKLLCWISTMHLFSHKDYLKVWNQIFIIPLVFKCIHNCSNFITPNDISWKFFEK